MFRWTDNKIPYHSLTCVIVFACIRLLELKVGGDHSAKTIAEEMHNLFFLLSWHNGATKLEVQLEGSNKLQLRSLLPWDTKYRFDFKGSSLITQQVKSVGYCLLQCLRKSR